MWGGKELYQRHYAAEGPRATARDRHRVGDHQRRPLFARRPRLPLTLLRRQLRRTTAGIYQGLLILICSSSWATPSAVKMADRVRAMYAQAQMGLACKDGRRQRSVCYQTYAHCCAP